MKIRVLQKKLFRVQVRAFSLVEVVIALALISFAAISIMGLLPTGLSTLRDAMNQSRQAQILRTVAGLAAVTKFTSLATNGLYFDSDGIPVSDSANAIFTVNVLTNLPVYPGSTNAAALQNALTALRVQIIWAPAPHAPGRTNWYSLQVANDGK